MRTLVVLAALTTVIVAFQQRARVLDKLRDPAGGHISDFDRWMIMTPRFVNEHADYVNDELPTPPITIAAFAPLAGMGRPNAIFVWVLLKLPIVFAVFLLAQAIVRRAAGIEFSTAGILLILFGWWLAVIVDLQEGQTNFMALLPVMVGLWLAQRETTAGDVAAGFFVGLGVAVKLTPLVFVGYFVWRRRWTIAAAAMTSVGLWWLIVPAVIFGWEQNVTWFKQWATIMIVPYVTRGDLVYSTSQSVGSFALRLLSHAHAFETRHGGILEPHYMNVLDLGYPAVRLIVRGLMAGCALAGLWWMRRPLASLRAPRYVLEIGAVSAFMLWFSERTWVHHYVSFILLLAAAAMIVSDRKTPDSARTTVIRAALVFFACTLFASEAGGIFGRDGIDWARAAGVYLVPSILLTIAVLRTGATRTPRWDG